MPCPVRSLSRFLVAGLALAAFCLCLALPAQAAQERRVALVIGNGAYRAAPLKNPPNDARDMAATLKSLGFEVIARENATLRQMNEAIDQFWASLKQGGVGVFFFAGHGLQVAGENYLVPVDARVQLESDVQYECVNAGRVLGRMEDAGNGLNIVILDACRNNPFARSFRSASRGLAKMDAPTGSLVAFATAPGDVAADGQGRNGLYTGHLLRNLRIPGLTIENVLKRTRIGVANDSAKLGKRQTPWESSSLMGDFYFSGGPESAPPVLPQAPASAPVQALAPAAAPAAAASDAASRFVGRYAVAPGPDKTPGPLIIAFALDNGRLVATPSGGASSAQPVRVTDIRVSGDTVRFRYVYNLVVFGVASERYTDFSGELGEDLSAVPFTFVTHDGNSRKGWLVRLAD